MCQGVIFTIELERQTQAPSRIEWGVGSHTALIAERYGASVNWGRAHELVRGECLLTKGPQEFGLVVPFGDGFVPRIGGLDVTFDKAGRILGLVNPPEQWPRELHQAAEVAEWLRPRLIDKAGTAERLIEYVGKFGWDSAYARLVRQQAWDCDTNFSRALEERRAKAAQTIHLGRPHTLGDYQRAWDGYVAKAAEADDIEHSRWPDLFRDPANRIESWQKA